MDDFGNAIDWPESKGFWAAFTFVIDGTEWDSYIVDRFYGEVV